MFTFLFVERKMTFVIGSCRGVCKWIEDPALMFYVSETQSYFSDMLMYASSRVESVFHRDQMCEYNAIPNRFIFTLFPESGSCSNDNSRNSGYVGCYFYRVNAYAVVVR